jgi:hypothetical protein
VNEEVIDAKKTTAIAEPPKVHPWVYAIVFAEGDLALVAEINRVDPIEITKFAIEHAEDITTMMYEAFKGKLIKEMQSRLPDLSDGNLLKLFEVVKGNPGFAQVVVEAGGGDGERPKFTLNMGVKGRSYGSDD